MVTLEPNERSRKEEFHKADDEFYEAEADPPAQPSHGDDGGHVDDSEHGTREPEKHVAGLRVINVALSDSTILGELDVDEPQLNEARLLRRIHRGEERRHRARLSARTLNDRWRYEQPLVVPQLEQT